MSATRTSSRIGTIVGIALTVIFLITAAWIFLNRQYVTDQITVWSYQPTPAIEAISERVEFTPKGEFLFYATRPEVAQANQFNQDCPRQEPGSAILGCYKADRIFIYDITNEQLDGIKEVTATHEMLHGAWARLSAAEQERLSKLLQAEYQKHVQGELKERMGYYERNEADQVVNELHSILPTEVRELSPELETYYEQYFRDRQKVVGLFDSYNSVFQGLKAESDTLFQQLTALSSSIEGEKAAYDQQSQQLATDIQTFNERAESGGFTSLQEFNTARAQLVNRSEQLEQNRLAVSASIDRYNTVYQQYQRVATDLDTLSSSIDSIPDVQQAPTITE